MYYDQFFPFYMTYTDPAFRDGERIQEDEFALMKSYYPDTAALIQEIVEEECRLLDYEGSWIYDEYPDRLVLRRACAHIREQALPQMRGRQIPDGFLDELIEVLLFQEMVRRRCRRRRWRKCGKYF